MARRILNRKEMRADFDAAERRKEDDEEEQDDEEEEEGDDEEVAEADEEGADADEETEADEEAPPPKKRKAAPKAAKAPKAPKTTKAKPRSRTAKVVRMKVVWGVFNNSNQRVAAYDYPKRKDADEHARRLTEEKKQGHPFFVQPVKEPIEEKKEKEG